MILKSDIILPLISNNKVADGFFFFFLAMAFMSKAARTKITSFSESSSCMVAYLDQNLQCMKRLHYTTKGQTFNGIQKIKRFHNLLCLGSLVSKWQQNITLHKNKQTNKY